MGGVPRSNDLGSRLTRIERAIRDLQRNSTLNSASISEGTLTIRRGGRIRVIDNGSIIGEGTGVIDWAGDAHIGGDTHIDGNTTLGGDIVLEANGEVRIGHDARLIVQGDDEGDNPVVTVGDLFHDGQFIGRGMRVMDRDGKLIFIASENLVDDSNWIGIFDGHENEVVHPDRISGYGLAGPQMAYPWLVDEFPTGWRTRETTDWGTLYDCRFPAIHPKVLFQLAFATSGAQGQLRLLINGAVQWTSSTLTSSGVHNVDIQVSDLPDVAPNKVLHAEFQARVVGSGTIWCRPLLALGQGT